MMLIRSLHRGQIKMPDQRSGAGYARVSVILVGFAAAVLAGPTTVAAQAVEPATKPPSPAVESAGASDLQRRVQALVIYAKAMQAVSDNQDFRAIDLLKQVVELDPASPVPHATLGEIYYGRRNTLEARREAEQAIKLDPKSLGGHRLLGRLLRDQAMSSVDKSQAGLAIGEFKEVVAIDDQDLEAWQSLASLYALTDQKEEFMQALRRWTSNDPTADQAFYQLASLHFDKREFRQAAENAARAMTVNPTNESAIMLARSLLALGQAREALQTYRDALARDAKSADLQISYSEALIYAGQYDEAVDALRKVIEADPGNLEAVRLTAQAQRRAGKRREAIQTLQQALKGRDVSESIDLQVSLAETHEELGEVDEAARSYEEVLNSLLNPDGTLLERFRRPVEDLLVRVALLYRQAGRRTDMEQTLGRMRQVLGPGSTRPDLILIDSLREEQDYAGMLKKTEEAIARYPDEPDFKMLKAQALGHLNRRDEALQLLDALLTGSIDDLQVLSTKAAVLTDAERYREAEGTLREALKRDQKNNQLLVQLSMVEEKLGRAAEAEATLRQILQQDPDNPTALNNLGYYLAERRERLEEALQLTQRAVNIAPTNGSFLDSLGWVYFQMNRLDEARRYLEQALLNQPNDGTIHEHVGDLYRKQGRLDQARRAWQRSLQLIKEKSERERIQKKLDLLLEEKTGN